MPTILQLCRRLNSPPVAPSHPGFTVRHFGGDADIASWLELRHQAFARERVGVRRWSRNDFVAEFCDRWWWRPDCMWLAEPLAPLPADSSSAPQLVGSVTLAIRGRPPDARPVIHWLMVLPSWRRRGIARLLIAHLEAAAWNAGHRQLWLETHTAWDAAVTFYEVLGYTPEHP